MPRPAAAAAARRHQRAAAGAAHRGRRRSAVFAALLASLAVALGWFAWQQFCAGRVVLTFRSEHAAVPDLTLTFFPDQLAFAAPSPPPPLGSVQLVGTSSIAVRGEMVPGHAVVRYEGAGVGTGFVHVRLGQEPPAIQLRPPGALVGRVGAPIGFWCFGWRCAGYRPVAGAEVVAMGGGEHGIVLASARTDHEGRFRLEGFDRGLVPLGLRVRAAGHAIGHQPVPEGTADDDLQVVALATTTPMQGRVRVPAGLDPTTLHVLARGLPGIEAIPDAEGEFTLDFLPPGVEPRLIVYGLGATFAHAPVRGRAGAAVQIEVVPAAVVRGRVVDATSRAGLGGALVFCGEGDAVRADADGCFELARILPGDVDIAAQWQSSAKKRRPVTRSGRTRLQLAGGQVVEDCVVVIE